MLASEQDSCSSRRACGCRYLYNKHIFVKKFRTFTFLCILSTALLILSLMTVVNWAKLLYV